MSTPDGLPTGSEEADVVSEAKEAAYVLEANPHPTADDAERAVRALDAAVAEIIRLRTDLMHTEQDAEALRSQVGSLRAALAGSGEREAKICVNCGRPEWQGGICPMSSGTAASHVYGYRLASAPPEASEEPTVDFDLDLVRKPDGSLEWEDETTRPVPPVEPEGGER